MGGGGTTGRSGSGARDGMGWAALDPIPNRLVHLSPAVSYRLVQHQHIPPTDRTTLGRRVIIAVGFAIDGHDASSPMLPPIQGRPRPTASDPLRFPFASSSVSIPPYLHS